MTSWEAAGYGGLPGTIIAGALLAVAIAMEIRYRRH